MQQARQNASLNEKGRRKITWHHSTIIHCNLLVTMAIGVLSHKLSYVFCLLPSCHLLLIPSLPYPDHLLAFSDQPKKPAAIGRLVSTFNKQYSSAVRVQCIFAVPSNILPDVQAIYFCHFAVFFHPCSIFGPSAQLPSPPLRISGPNDLGLFRVPPD